MQNKHLLFAVFLPFFLCLPACKAKRELPGSVLKSDSETEAATETQQNNRYFFAFTAQIHTEDVKSAQSNGKVALFKRPQNTKLNTAIGDIISKILEESLQENANSSFNSNQLRTGINIQLNDLTFQLNRNKEDLKFHHGVLAHVSTDSKIDVDINLKLMPLRKNQTHDQLLVVVQFTSENLTFKAPSHAKKTEIEAAMEESYGKDDLDLNLVSHFRYIATAKNIVHIITELASFLTDNYRKVANFISPNRLYNSHIHQKLKYYLKNEYKDQLDGAQRGFIRTQTTLWLTQFYTEEFKRKKFPNLLQDVKADVFENLDTQFIRFVKGKRKDAPDLDETISKFFEQFLDYLDRTKKEIPGELVLVTTVEKQDEDEKPNMFAWFNISMTPEIRNNRIVKWLTNKEEWKNRVRFFRTGVGEQPQNSETKNPKRNNNVETQVETKEQVENTLFSTISQIFQKVKGVFIRKQEVGGAIVPVDP